MILTPFDLRCPVDLFHLRIGAQCLFAPYAMKLQKSFKIRVSKYDSKYTYHICYRPNEYACRNCFGL